jgi:antitoxin MazE
MNRMGYTYKPVKVSKWGNSLAIRLPSGLVRELGLSEGDELDLSSAGKRAIELSKLSREEGLASLTRYRGFLPDDFRFDRAEANAR